MFVLLAHSAVLLAKNDDSSNNLGLDFLDSFSVEWKVIFMFGLAALSTSIAAYTSVFVTKVSSAYVMNLRTEILRAAIEAEWDVLKGGKRDRIAPAMTMECARIESAAAAFLGLPSLLAIGAVQVASAVALAPMATVIAAAFGALIIPVFLNQSRRARVQGKILSNETRRLVGGVGQFSDNLKFLHANRTAVEPYKQTRITVRQLRATGLRYSRLQARGRIEVSIAMILVLGISVVAFSEIGIGPATMILVLAVLTRVSLLAQGTLSQLAALAHVMPAFLEVSNLKKIGCRTGQRDSRSAAPIQALARGIELRGVSSCVNDLEVEVRKIDAMFPANRVSLILGPSGSGKTSLLDFISGISIPACGEVKIDGVQVGLASGLGVHYMPQGFSASSATVRSAFEWDGRVPSDGDIWKALQVCQMDRMLRQRCPQLDLDLQTVGSQLSGGERQRLTVAMFLAKNPAVLLLDEALNAVDAQMSSEILLAVQANYPRTTVILVAHAEQLSESCNGVVINLAE